MMRKASKGVLRMMTILLSLVVAVNASRHRNIGNTTAIVLGSKIPTSPPPTPRRVRKSYELSSAKYRIQAIKNRASSVRRHDEETTSGGRRKNRDHSCPPHGRVRPQRPTITEAGRCVEPETPRDPNDTWEKEDEEKAREDIIDELLDYKELFLEFPNKLIDRDTGIEFHGFCSFTRGRHNTWIISQLKVGKGDVAPERKRYRKWSDHQMDKLLLHHLSILPKDAHNKRKTCFLVKWVGENHAFERWQLSYVDDEEDDIPPEVKFARETLSRYEDSVLYLEFPSKRKFGKSKPNHFWAFEWDSDCWVVCELDHADGKDPTLNDVGELQAEVMEDFLVRHLSVHPIDTKQRAKKDAYLVDWDFERQAYTRWLLDEDDQWIELEDKRVQTSPSKYSR